MRRLIIVFMVVVCILAVTMPAIGFNSKKEAPLKQGVFLVAKPELIDPNFLHTVILLVSYGKDGALGVIINRPTEITIQQAIPDIKEPKNAASNIYFGGPVNRNNLFALFTSDKKPDNAQNVIGKIYFSGSKEAILSLLKSEDKKVRHGYMLDMLAGCRDSLSLKSGAAHGGL